MNQSAVGPDRRHVGENCGGGGHVYGHTGFSLASGPRLLSIDRPVRILKPIFDVGVTEPVVPVEVAHRNTIPHALPQLQTIGSVQRSTSGGSVGSDARPHVSWINGSHKPLEDMRW